VRGVGKRGESQDQPSRATRFEAIFSANHPRVLAYALRRAEDPDSAEEAVSETFLIAWRRLEVVPAEQPLPWLLGAARRVLANQRRAAKRRAPDGPHTDLSSVEVRDPGPPIPEELAEREAFAAAFAALGDRDREVLSLIAWDGLRVGEAAEVMRCTAAAFSIRLHRARRRLLKELEASGHSLGERSIQPPLVERPGTTEAR
jgi:RNA polymerase sigma-70 factor, ECF subfamily